MLSFGALSHDAGCPLSGVERFKFRYSEVLNVLFLSCPEIGTMKGSYIFSHIFL